MKEDVRYRFGIADIAMITTTLLWAINAVLSKNAIGGYEGAILPFVFNGLRIPLGAMLLFMTLRSRGESLKIGKSHLPLVLGISFFGMFLFMTGFIWGLDLTSASNAGIVNATVPLFIVLISFLTGSEKPTRRVLLGIVIGFSGMLALTYQAGSITLNSGDLLILAACACWGIYTVYGKQVLVHYSPILVNAWVYLFVSIFQIPLFAMQIPSQDWGSITALNWFYLVFSTVGSIFIANTLYYYSITKIGATRVAVYTNLTPVFTLLFASLMRGEDITLIQTAGLVVILSGIAISRGRRKKMTLVKKSDLG